MADRRSSVVDDPREPAPSPEEVGRGPLPEETGRFKAVRLVRGRRGARIHGRQRKRARVDHSFGGSERGRDLGNRSSNGISSVGPSAESLWIVLGSKAPGTTVAICDSPGITPTPAELSSDRAATSGPLSHPAAPGSGRLLRGDRGRHRADGSGPADSGRSSPGTLAAGDPDTNLTVNGDGRLRRGRRRAASR